MKIALYHDLPPGGALRHLVATTARSATEHEYTLFSDRPERVEPVELVDAVSRVVLVPVQSTRPVGGRVRPVYFAHRRQARVAEMIDDGEYDLAVVHPSLVTHAPHVLSTLTRTPSVYIAHEGRRRSYEAGYLPWLESGSSVVRIARQIGRAPIERVLRRWDAKATRDATALVANSAFTAENIARVYGRTASVVHPGVDVSEFPPGVGPRAGVVSVGAMDPTKGHELVVEALGLIPASHRPTLTVVYERSDPRFVERLGLRATDLGVELLLRNNVTNSEVAAVYAGAAVTVAAARLEPFGLTVLESIAAGTPVVAVREGGFRETLVPGRNGELVDRDPVALASGIEHVLATAASFPPCELRSALLPYWSWDRAVEELHQIFQITASTGR